MIKPQYELNKPNGFIGYDGLWHEYTSPGIYSHKRIWFCRLPKTQNERRANCKDKPYVRGKRRKLPSSWDDMRPSFGFGNCWKRFTKNKHQWQH